MGDPGSGRSFASVAAALEGLTGPGEPRAEVMRSSEPVAVRAD